MRTEELSAQECSQGVSSRDEQCFGTKTKSDTAHRSSRPARCTSKSLRDWPTAEILLGVTFTRSPAHSLASDGSSTVSHANAGESALESRIRYRKDVITRHSTLFASIKDLVFHGARLSRLATCSSSLPFKVHEHWNWIIRQEITGFARIRHDPKPERKSVTGERWIGYPKAKACPSCLREDPASRVYR